MENFSFSDLQMGHLSKNYGFDLTKVVKVKLPGHRPGLPGNVISFCTVPLDPAYKAGLAGHVPVNVKEDFFVYLEDGRVIHIPFEEIDSIARPACMVCSDFSAEYSDTSFGGLGSPEGYTTVLIRSEKGKWAYEKPLPLVTSKREGFHPFRRPEAIG